MLSQLLTLPVTVPSGQENDALHELYSIFGYLLSMVSSVNVDDVHSYLTELNVSISRMTNLIRLLSVMIRLSNDSRQFELARGLLTTALQETDFPYWTASLVHKRLLVSSVCNRRVYPSELLEHLASYNIICQSKSDADTITQSKSIVAAQACSLAQVD